MSPDGVSQLPIENFYLSNTQVGILIMGLMEFLLLHFFLDTKRICTFFWRSNPTSITTTPQGLQHQKKRRGDSDSLLSIQDAEIVLKSLGISPTEESQLPMKTDVDSIYNMLEEEEENISPDEVQDVFDIFDKNGDGFIDPQELQTILCNLGFEEGADLNNCRRMVEVFDENDDGRIDFDEFVKFIQYTSSS